MNVLVSSDPKRASFKRVTEFIRQHGLNPADFIIQDHYLRLEAAIGTATSYEFDFYENRGADSATEIKLNRNDTFFMSGFSLQIAKITTGTNTLGNVQPFTYPDPTAFPGAGEVAALEAFYLGTLTFSTNAAERIQDFYTNQLRYLPLFDQPNAWGPNEEERGIYRMSNSVIFDGQQDNKAVLTVPGNADIAAAVVAGEVNSLILVLQGQLITQGSSKLGKYF